ncbi:MAG: hypothetical protein EOP49_36515, partial [Sphingobacteriales bacterium]
MDQVVTHLPSSRSGKIAQAIRYLILISLVVNVTQSFAQTIPVGSIGLEDYYRRAQLLGEVDPAVSFTIRPVSPTQSFGRKDIFYPDSLVQRRNFLGIEPMRINSSKIKTVILPFSFQAQTNTHHAYGWNDGAMIPAKGLQSVVSAGLYAEWGPISLQLRPELVNASNSEFETFDKDHYDIIFARYYDYYNRIDAPVRFGTKAFSKLYLGQSSLKVNYKGFSAGFSSENLWWGPGMRNALLMTNTAPGFNHLTINTDRPFKTAIGAFEGQLVAGRLDGSGFGVLEPEKDYIDGPLYFPKRDDWRLFSGMVLSWNPKWVPGLFVGLSRSKQMYSDDITGAGDYFPFFSTVKKADADAGLEKKDIRSSLFLRWVWPEEQAEIYGEFGRDNVVRSARQAALQPDRGRAYVVGVRKIVNLSGGRGHKLMVHIEATQLQQTQVDDVLGAKSWYVNSYVRHGYTN